MTSLKKSIRNIMCALMCDQVTGQGGVFQGEF